MRALRIKADKMVQKIFRRNRSSNRKSYVILFLILIVGFGQLNGLPTNEFVEKCEQRCKDQNRTHFELMSGDDETLCKSECQIKQCGIGCTLWESALDASCQKVCNKTEMSDFDNRQIFCVKGCNDALFFYFQWIKQEVPSLMAPALVPDSLTSRTLSLEWSVPSKFYELAKGDLFKKTKNETYFVQCFEDLDVDWKICGNQTIYDNSTIHMEQLHPYTQYKFRVALLLSENEAIYSDPSVVIHTNEEGIPESPPILLQVSALDQTRVMVSWKPGPKNNGPVLSYKLEINDFISFNLTKDGQPAEQINNYTFDQLRADRAYSISIWTQNKKGFGPPVKVNASIPPYLNNEQNTIANTKLIWALEHSILSQGTDILQSPADTFYTTPSRIVSIALDVHKQLLFVVEEDGCIYQSSLDATDKTEKREVICQKSGLNFKPLLVSVDWLNDHLYIMGEIKSNAHHDSWSISRCEQDGKNLHVAVGGLTGRPTHIEVDPYNGYLFWVIPKESVDSGLYRLDLGEISNGIKHETKPFPIIKGGNLGAFIVFYSRVHLYVSMQDNNTISSVSLNGNDQQDIRKNALSPLMQSVKSLAMVNELFFWTNGKEILTEEFHHKRRVYYHNSFPDPSKSNTSLIAVAVNSTLAQPIPVPKNSPESCQALMSSTHAKVSWQTPQLVGDQGKGAFKDWLYRLEVSGDNKSEMFENIVGNSVVVEPLKPNTLYSFKVAAYTSGGSGQFSQKFSAKTLKTSVERYLVWASRDGLMQSDVIGENISTLLPKEEIGNFQVSDITWFEHIFYIVMNSTLKIYNRTNGDLKKLGELDSVGGVAVDWIGRRLYWSNPTQQVINRGKLNGEPGEPLSIVAAAKEIKIDALRGNIYFSTGLTVESCRLNGKHPKKYFTVPPYSGKQVMGLTLDLDDQKIYWIVRSYQGSSLYSAKLLDMWLNETEPEVIETKLEEKSLNGPLTHFSDRLVWRKDDKTIVFGDMAGKNLAYFKNDKLTGLTCIMVIDKSHHVFPEIEENINVIPDAIPNASIKVIGTYKLFNITWDPVENVNFGHVSYEIKIKSSKIADINAEQKENVFQFTNRTLDPFTPLDIYIRAFTFWGSSPVARVSIHSPPGPPSEPTNPRVYTRHLSRPLEDTMSISATFLWSLPLQPNGKILGYKVRCYEFRSNGEMVLHDNKTVIGMEQVFTGLRRDDSYTFEVSAYTSVGEGNTSEPVCIETTHERPIPKVLVSTQEDILEVDLDKQKYTMLQSTNNPIVAFTHIAHEQKLFWFDENNLVSYHIETHTKTKLISVTSLVKCMTIDWIERVIYWSQIEDEKSVIYSLNLNKAENFNTKTSQKLSDFYLWRQNVISDLVVSPFDRKLIWIETRNNLSEESEIYVHDMVTNETKTFFGENEVCMNKTSNSISPIPGTLLFSTSPINPSNSDNEVMNHRSRLIFEMNQFPQQFVATDLESKECFDFGMIVPSEGTNLAKDSNKVYWIHGGMVYAREDMTKKIFSLQVTQNTNKVLAFYQQKFPKRDCLIPAMSSDYVLKLKTSTDVSLTLELPKPKLPSSCNLPNIPIRYTIQYTDVKHIDKRVDQIHQCTSNEDCHSINTFEQFETIENLKPFTNYFIRVAMSSVFNKSEETDFVASADFMTEPGRPSPPRNISAIPLSFNEIRVRWFAPEAFNSPGVSYEIHWQQENMIEHIRNKQQRTLPPQDVTNVTDDLISTVIKVLPNQSYSIFVRAYSKNQTFSESDSVIVLSYPEPPPIRLYSRTSTSMIVKWNKPENIVSSNIQFSKVDSHETFNVSKLDKTDEEHFECYLVDSLEPKTKYNFSILLGYMNSNRTYRWAPSEKIEFETFGDVPSSPGKPLVQYVKETVYKVSWNASRDNGAPIIKYILESKRVANQAEYDEEKNSRYKRSVESNDISMDNNEVDIDEEATEIPPDTDPEEKWKLHYNGTESHSIITDLNPIDHFIFRVKAVNSYGSSLYSTISDFINSTSLISSPSNNSNGEKSNVPLLLISMPLSIFIFGIFLVCSILIVNRNRRNKKFHEEIMPIPDFELATIHGINSGEHLILSNRNILYNQQFYGSAIVNTEIKHLPHIHLSQIIITDRCLGKGAFGEVWCGMVHNEDGTDERVAIKTLHKGANDIEKREFLQEAQLMSNFKHDHILRLIGICLNKNESLLYIVMELMEGGDLLSFLRVNRPSTDRASSLKLLDLVSMCVDVSSGCRYLEEMHFVHRDIAARNCLVKNVAFGESGEVGRVVKIGDFGLARDIYKNDYYRKEGEGLLPVRWMSPESLIDGVFTSQSDIWAFGVLMWEVITLGQQPYQGHTNLEVLQYVRAGGRLPRPIHNCSEELYLLMTKCWNRVDQRPTFRYCLEVLQQLLERKNLYAHIEAQFPHDVPYKHVSSDDSSIINEKLSVSETSFEPLNLSQGNPSMPKYLELMYDENDSRSVENMCVAPFNYCEKHQNDENDDVSYRNSQMLNNVKDNVNGYEIPISLDPTLDINANNELNSSLSKSRTLSNSSTVSNKSDHYPKLPEKLPDSCKRSSLIMEREHKIYPSTKMITRQSGWV